MSVFRKQTTRRKKSGSGKRETIHSKRFYGTLTDANGKRKQVALCEDRQASLTLLKRLQTEADRERALGIPRHSQERQRPLDALVDEYATFLRSKGDSVKHVAQTKTHIKRLLCAAKMRSLCDLDASRLTNTLADWRNRKAKPLSIRTTNYYARAVKGFSRWLWIDGRTPDDALRSLRLLNASVGIQRFRRSLTPDELRRLLHATRKSKRTTYGLKPDDRAMLYTLAAYTGLRASELASLTPASFDLQSKTVSVQAAYSKRRRNDVLPLHASLIPSLTTWLKTKKASVRLWRGTWLTKHKVLAAPMLRKDLKEADIAYVIGGRYADFHALRHTFISSLAHAGVHPSKAKELARHSTIALTMGADVKQMHRGGGGGERVAIQCSAERSE